MPSSHCVLPFLAPLRRLAACAAVLALGLSLGAGTAEAKHQKNSSASKSSTNGASNGASCSQRYRLKWTMPIQSSDVGKSPAEVFKRSEFSSTITLRDPQRRLAIGRAPDGTPSIQMNVRKGENQLTSMMWAPFGKVGEDVTCLTVDVFLERGFDWGTSGTKLGFGLWGGSEKEQSGGVKPQDQLGWSVRNVHNYYYGLKLYSYHLNRPSNFGVISSPGQVIPVGSWARIDLEVKMNNIGRNDGYAKLWVNGAGTGDLENLVFRYKKDWATRGVKFSDMWGGNTSDKANFSPKDQKMWYANYRLYTP